MSVVRQDRHGTVSVLMALSVAVLLCFMGLVIDLGDINAAHRRLQGAADLAAAAAASNLSGPAAAASTVAVDNGYVAGAVASVVTGTYTPDPTVAVAQRFTASTQNVNAVQVTMSNPQPLFFNTIFNLAGQRSGSAAIGSTQAIGAQAVAVNVVQAAFTIGSSLATVNGGIVNSVLGGLFGTSLSLSAVDYAALAGGQVDLFQFSNELAAELGVSGITYKQLLSGTVSVGQFVRAIQLATAGGAATTAVADLYAALAGDSQTINLAQLLNLGYFSNYTVGGPNSMAATVSIYQLLSQAAQIAGAGHLVSFNLNAGISGIASATATLSVGEPATSTAMITVGYAGATVHTAQSRLVVNITLGSTLLGATVQVPLYLEIASGTATLSSISCNVLDATSESVGLNVTPGVASLSVGSIGAADLTNFSIEPTVVPGLLSSVSVLGVGVVSVSGLATAQISNMQPTSLTFSYANIQSQAMQATSTQDYFATLFASALGSLKLSATILGVSTSVPAAANQLGTILAAASAPIDQLVSGVLQSAGISLGVADSWVGGLNCTPAVIAQ